MITETKEVKYTSFEEIRENEQMFGLNIIGNIHHIGTPRVFSRATGDGQVLNITLAADGLLRVTFWDDMATHIYEQFKVGDVLDLRNVYSKYNDYSGSMEVTANSRTRIIKSDKEIEYFPQFTEIGLVERDKYDVNVIGKVCNIDTIREFDRADGSTGCVGEFTVYDETGTISIKCWDDMCAILDEIEYGQYVQVTGINTRFSEFNKVVEGHLQGSGSVSIVELVCEDE